MGCGTVAGKAAIVTTIEGPVTWYPAETYHQKYWEGEVRRNPYWGMG